MIYAIDFWICCISFIVSYFGQSQMSNAQFILRDSWLWNVMNGIIKHFNGYVTQGDLFQPMKQGRWHRFSALLRWVACGHVEKMHRVKRDVGATKVIYPLVNIQFAIENGPVEIVDFPIKNDGSFHSYVSHNQRVPPFQHISKWTFLAPAADQPC